MKMTRCPKCGVDVAFASDSICPACRQSVTDSDDTVNRPSGHPFAPPVKTPVPIPATEGMTLAEKIYTAFVVLCIGYYAVCIALF